MAARPKNLTEVYDKVLEVMKEVCGHFSVRTPKPRRYDLYCKKVNIKIDQRVHKEVMFASVIEQKGYVSFHFMPIYLVTSMKGGLPPALMSKLASS
jgi:hypothetical protein